MSWITWLDKKNAKKAAKAAAKQRIKDHERRLHDNAVNSMSFEETASFIHIPEGWTGHNRETVLPGELWIDTNGEMHVVEGYDESEVQAFYDAQYVNNGGVRR